MGLLTFLHSPFPVAKKAVHLRLDNWSPAAIRSSHSIVGALVILRSRSLALASFQKFFLYVFLYFGPKHVLTPLIPYYSSCTGHPLF
jgi:hypothetical protein